MSVISAIASTSSVVRGGPAPSSVTSRLVTAPPTNTRSPSIGRSSAAVAISCSRFEFGIDLVATAGVTRSRQSYALEHVHHAVRRRAPIARRRARSRSAAIGAVLYKGASETPRCLPSSYGQTGIGSSVGAISARNGAAPYEVATPRVSSPRSAGNAYFNP